MNQQHFQSQQALHLSGLVINEAHFHVVYHMFAPWTFHYRPNKTGLVKVFSEVLQLERGIHCSHSLGTFCPAKTFSGTLHNGPQIGRHSCPVICLLLLMNVVSPAVKQSLFWLGYQSHLNWLLHFHLHACLHRVL